MALGFEITVVGPDGMFDACVEAGARADVRDLAAVLADRAGIAGLHAEHGGPLKEVALRRGPRQPLLEGLLADCGLCAGDVVLLESAAAEAGLGSPAPEPDLRVIEGPDTGLTAELPPGGVPLEVSRVLSEEQLAAEQPGNQYEHEHMLWLNDEWVSQPHAMLWREGGAVYVFDSSSRNHTSVAGDPIPPRTPTRVTPGSVVSFGPYTRILVGALDIDIATGAGAAGLGVGTGTRGGQRFGAPVVADPAARLVSGHIRFVRRPYQQTAPLLPTLPRPHEPQAKQYGMLATSLGLTAAMSIAQVGLLAVFQHSGELLVESAVIVSTNLVGNGARQVFMMRQRSPKGYQQALEEHELSVQQRLDQERMQLTERFPDPAQLNQAAVEAHAELWERRPGTPDFLKVRVGIGSVSSVLAAESSAGAYPNPGIEALYLHNVPVTVDVSQHRVVGVTGPAAQARSSAYWIVAQALAQSGPADLSVAVLTDPDDAQACEAWWWARWLPHATTAEGKVQVVRHGGHEQLRQLIKQIKGGTPAASGADSSWLVVVDGLSEHDPRFPELVDVLRPAEGSKTRVVAVCSDRARMPYLCTAVLDVAERQGTVLGALSVAGSGAPTQLVADQVHHQWAEHTGRMLARLEDPELRSRTAALPADLPLLDLLERIDPEPDGRLRVVIGQGLQGPVYADFDAFPHMIVAGKVGSGKSVLLHTLVGGLARSQPPDRIAFALLDYKGGATFGYYRDLPNAAVVTSRDAAKAVMRALISLVFTMVERQSFLTGLGLEKLSQYHAKLADGAVPPDRRRPMPSLFVVIDEYARLKRDVPEAEGLLDQIAEQGRSAGVHLIIGSQRPKHMSPDFQRQCGQRIGLLMDEEDSQILLGSKIAVTLETQGRACLQTDEPAQQIFQAAHLRGDHRPFAADEVRVTQAWPEGGPDARSDEANSPDVERLCRLVKHEAASLPHPVVREEWCPWLDELPETLAWEHLPRAQEPLDGFGHGGGISLEYGLADYPERRSQGPAAWRIGAESSSNLLIFGNLRSGRSTALRALAASAGRPEAGKLQVYAADFGDRGHFARFVKALPNCARVVAQGDPWAAAKALLDELEEQRAARAANGQGAQSRPVLLLLIDGWQAWHEFLADKQSPSQLNEILSTLARLMQLGPAVGVHVAATGSAHQFNRYPQTGSRSMVGGVDEHLYLRSPESEGYPNGIPKNLYPTSGIVGRAVRMATHDGTRPAAVQVALVRGAQG